MAAEVGDFIFPPPYVPALPSPAPMLSLPPAKLTLSYSSVSSYQRCPHRYYLKYVQKLPEAFPPSQAAALAHGKVVHKALEMLVRTHAETGTVAGLHMPTVAAAAIAAVAEKEPLPAPPEGMTVEATHAAMAEEVAQVLSAWVAPERFVHENVLLDGEELRETLMTANGVEVQVVGFPDRILFQPPRDYIIVDHKTGSASYGPAKLRESLQLRMYALLWLLHLTRHPERARHQGSIRIRLSYSKVTKEGVKDTGVYLMPSEMEEVQRLLRNVALDILDQKFPPWPGRSCSTCPFGRKGCSFSTVKEVAMGMQPP